MNPPHDTLPRTKQDVKTKIDAGVPTWRGGDKQLRIQTFALRRIVLEKESWQTQVVLFRSETR